MRSHAAQGWAVFFLVCFGLMLAAQQADSAPFEQQPDPGTRGQQLLAGAAEARKSGLPGFPQTIRVRLWYLRPPHEILLHAEPGKAHFSRCATCKSADLVNLVISASTAHIRIQGVKNPVSELRLNGIYQLNAASEAPIKADFPTEIRAADGALRITALMPMDEYVAGVLAGEVGNFKSDEALKAMAVAARTYALHFGSRHAVDGFEFCDSTHCQNVHASAIDPRLRRIAESTSGEVLWYDGEPAAAYYHASCGGTTEDGRCILGNDETRAPFLRQHADQYCVRNGTTEWRSEISKHDLHSALHADGIEIPGTLRAVAVAERTPSGRVEFLRLAGRGTVTVPAVTLRLAIGRHLGWNRLKSNWYDVSDAGDQIIFRGRGSGHGVGLCQIGAEVMGEEGHSYREILAFYYPGTQLGVGGRSDAWQQLASEDIVLLTTQPDRDRALMQLATRLLHESEEGTGLIYSAVPRLKVYASVKAYRDATGEPGWVAASTRGRTIQMQPADVLRSAGTLESTLRHELLHMLIEAYARPGTPLWFREGLVLYLSEPKTAGRPATLDVAALERVLRAPASEQQLREAYRVAHARVAQLAQQHGISQLLQWVQDGLPSQL